mgnify:CR=1 FL=1
MRDFNEYKDFCKEHKIKNCCALSLEKFIKEKTFVCECGKRELKFNEHFVSVTGERVCIHHEDEMVMSNTTINDEFPYISKETQERYKLVQELC